MASVSFQLSNGDQSHLQKRLISWQDLIGLRKESARQLISQLNYNLQRAFANYYFTQ